MMSCWILDGLGEVHSYSRYPKGRLVPLDVLLKKFSIALKKSSRRLGFNLMTFRRQMQAWLPGWQGLRVFHQLLCRCGQLEKLLCGSSLETPLHLAPYECPSRVGGTAGAGENKIPCVHQNPPV